MTPEQQVEQWLARLADERHASPHTVAGYRRDLAKLLRFMQEQRLASFDALDANRMRTFVAGEHRTGLAPKSLQRLLSSCRSLFRQLNREGRLASDPLLGVRGPKVRRKLPQVLDVDEATALVETDSGGKLAVRDRAMLELFYSSGLRLSELCGLRWLDLNLDEGEVRVLGKGAKERIVPVGEPARVALKAWLALRPDLPAPNHEAVFVSRSGRRLTARAIQQRLAGWAVKRGLARHVHPHMLRHSFASHLLQSSGDLRAVQELLGHASIASTQIYTHLDFQHLARVYDAAHPRAKRKP